MVIIAGRKVLLWICSWFDFYILWRWPRALLYRYALLRRSLLVTKWILHLLTGQSELARLLRADFDSTNKTTKILELIKYSMPLSRQWVKIQNSGKNEKVGEQVARQIAIKKAIPPKGALFRILQDAVEKMVARNRLLIAVEELRQTSFNHLDPTHNKLLTRFWQALKTGPMPPIPSEQWKELGFQGTDPSTDFRAMGMLSLQMLAYLVERQDGKAMYEEAQYGPYWYSFAVIGINGVDAIYRLLIKGRFDEVLYRDCSIELLNAEFVKLMVCFHTEWMQSKPANLFAFNDIFERSLTRYSLDIL